MPFGYAFLIPIVVVGESIKLCHFNYLNVFLLVFFVAKDLFVVIKVLQKKFK